MKILRKIYNTEPKEFTYILEYLLAIKKNKILPYVTVHRDLEGIMLSKISQRKKHNYYMTLLILESEEQNK